MKIFGRQINWKQGKRKRIKRRTIYSCGAAALILVIGGTLFLRKSGTAMADMVTGPQSAVVTKGDVSATIEGTGVLVNDETAKVNIPGGIVIEEIKVQAGDQVSAGDVLAVAEEISVKAELYSASETLSELASQITDADSDTAAYYELLREQKNITEKYEILSRIAETNAVVAETDGVVTAVNITEGTVSQSSTISSSETASAALASSMSTSNATVVKAVSLSTAGALETTADTPLASAAPAITVPVTGAQPQTKISGTYYTGEITWNPGHSVFEKNTVYTAIVTLKAKDGYYFNESTKVSVDGADILSPELAEEGDVLTFTASFAQTSEGAADSGSTNVNETKIQSESGQQPGSDQKTGSSQNQNTGSGSGNSLGSGSVSLAASGSNTDQSSAASTGSSAADNEELITAFGIAATENMTVNVSIDELDILSVSLGQRAILTLDAIEEEEFEGKITNINTSGSSSGGVTKYEVEVTVAKSASMLEGMNASVSIVVEESSDTLLIPSAALQQNGSQTFVYTEYDEGSLEYSGEVEVKIGNSDGFQVEVVSGLSEGDTVYYELTGSSDGEDGSAGFDMGGFPGGGDGQMPGSDGAGGGPGGGRPDFSGMPGGGM